MRRLAPTLVLAALLTACGSGTQQASTPPAQPPAAAPAAAPATDAPAQPTGIMGAPGFARAGVDSANAAQQRQLDSVNNLGNEGGTTTP
jgi:hypothetical protein